jgi:hypothetical protein
MTITVIRLSNPEIRILQYLAERGWVGRQELERECNASSKLLGAATQPDLGKQGGGLERKGLIESEVTPCPGERIRYRITSLGRQTLAANLRRLPR